MPIRNTPTSYGLLARLLHWTMALLVVGLFALGYWMRTLGYYDPWYQPAPELHKSLGVVLVVLLVVRLAWRTIDRPPEPLSAKPIERRAASIVHIVLYVLLIAMAMTGFMYATGDGKSISVFGWFDVPSVYTNKALADLSGDVHQWLAYTIITVAGLHAVAALKHHVVDRDATLRRMLTG